VSEDVLKAALLDILYELRESDIALLIGGGYGLFLKQHYLAASGETQTLFAPETWPQPRSTNDIDVLLRPEIVTESRSMGIIRKALDRLRFLPVPGAEYMQFVKPLDAVRSVKIDFLAGPLGKFEDPSKVKIDDRRIRPRPSVKLHAHRMDEAVVYEWEPTEVPVAGARSSGEHFEATIFIPQGFTFLLMKLHAFHDRRDDPKKDMAQHHALDLYRIVAMMTPAEYKVVERLAKDFGSRPAVRKASEIVRSFFSDPEQIGVLRMREHPLFAPNMKPTEFIEVLKELFPKM
jgi:hypothetical protein